jgi:7,8-dihydropterin-6-yl-methyl-4-(beta-D-ribofuranosyl)aminobenzene 5'-phosphate synthase
MAVILSRAYQAAVVSLFLAGFFGAPAALAAEAGANPVRITILYDAFGKPSAMKKDWGYAALIEYRGKRILFDTGDNPKILADNARAKGVDLSRLDFVVLSHRHSDHMGGLDHVLRVNPNVRIYAPKENFGIYGSSLPGTFYRRDASLPPEQQYFEGSPPPLMQFGSAWPRAHFELVDAAREVEPGIHLISLVSDKPGTLELRELSLAFETPDGLILVGGLHLVTASDPEIAKVVASLHDTWRVEYVAPGHCTGEPAFAALEKAFGDRYVYAGLGSRLRIDGTPRIEAVSRQ